MSPSAFSLFRVLSLRIRPEFGLLAVSLFLSFVLGELGLRLFLPLEFPDHRPFEAGQDAGFEFHKTFGWFPIPNSHRILTTDVRTISVDHNSNGFRDPEFDPSKRPGVIFLGDSYTWGYAVETGERFTDKLRGKHPEWSVYNFGVVGFSTDQEFLVLKKYIAEYRPRMVFLVFCVENDDVGNSGNRAGMYYYKPYFVPFPGGLKLKGVPVPASDRFFCLRHPILSKAYLIRLSVRAYANLKDPFPNLKQPPTTAIIREMQKYLAARGIGLAVGLTDSHPQLEGFLHGSKIHCVNLSTSLRYAPGDHWTADGNTVVAQRIEEFLLAGKYLDQK